MDCPGCHKVIKLGEKTCRCGWVESAGSAVTQFEICDRCNQTLVYPTTGDRYRGENKIIGRSVIGGFICRHCYQNGDPFDWRDKALADFVERRKSGLWPSLIEAAKTGKTDQDRSDLLEILKDQLKGIGKVPYDKSRRVA